jgi:nitrate reductase alpha subunit
LFAEAWWRVARTMPENPHSYTRRRDWRHDADFVFVVEFLRSGVCDREKFAGRWYDVLNRHGRKVWVMGWPINYSNGRWCTVILNKKPVEPSDL